MKFVLHHSQGTLKLSAGSREQALKWTERQLGRKAGMFSIMEEEVAETVERTGTGITAMIASRCQPVLATDTEMDSTSVPEPEFAPAMPTWH